MTAHLHLLLLFLLVLLHFSPAHSKRHRIWPHPQEVEVSDEFYLIYSRDFRFLVTNNGLRCDVIRNGVNRLRDRMFTQDCGKIDPRLAGTFLQPGHVDYRGDGNYRGVLKEIYIRFAGQCEHYPQMNMNERYEIRITDNGVAEVLATSVWGVLRGLDTFAQLVENVGANQFTVNKAKITDYPRFAHRGLMIDTSRHFLSVKSIYKTLNAMELNKLNVLHWHIVDDQAFPFQSLSYPQLSQKGAYIPETHVYRPKDVEGIIEYARLRGIRILIEFDTPGHTQSWGKGMPNLLTQCYANGKPNGNTGPIDPTKQSNYDFLKNLFTEVSRRFPDQYLHLGGDEVDTQCWASNPRVQAFMRKRNLNVAKLESFYIQRLVNIVKSLGKSYIVWQEVFDEGVRIKPDTIVHVWIEKRNGGWRKEMSKVTRAGYRTLLSAPWYLEEQVTESWRKYYETDPLDFDGTPQQKRLVLGGEACIWGEYADGGNIINKVWTTTSALAEKLWSPAWLKSAADAEWRFYRLHCRMQVQGIRVGPPSGPSYCPCDHVI